MERCRLLRLGKGGHNRFDHASRESQSGTDVTKVTLKFKSRRCSCRRSTSDARYVVHVQGG
ncbi:hypothetical protein K523DRAFT_155669 [Schizophyllum commune Tattone D]|nr:hypothetical protein K523DRAFT_155669 [Schizophyllum commune Tattone D]